MDIWLNGIMGIIIGDALGLPVQFKNRDEIIKNPVLEMIGYGTFNMPPGTWSDDSSLTIATLASINECERIVYEDIMNLTEWTRFGRISNLEEFATVPKEQIKSSGYVLHRLEATVWSLITTDTLEEGLLKAVNLGDDTDTVGAIAGGLAGLYYGYNKIPEAWRKQIIKKDEIIDLCRKVREKFYV